VWVLTVKNLGNDMREFRQGERNVIPLKGMNKTEIIGQPKQNN
jgi:hypothetical protein